MNLFESIGGGILGPDADEQVDMIGLDCQFLTVPALPGTRGLDQLAAIPGHIAHQDGLTPLGTPDEVRDDPMDTMLVALVLHVTELQVSRFTLSPAW